MTERSNPDPEFDGSRDADRLRQLELGLRLTPAERLRWLEECVESLKPWLGRARSGDSLLSTGRKLAATADPEAN